MTIENWKLKRQIAIMRSVLKLLKYLCKVESSKTKVKLPLCLTKYHSMKTYWGVVA